MAAQRRCCAHLHIHHANKLATLGQCDCAGHACTGSRHRRLLVPAAPQAQSLLRIQAGPPRFGSSCIPELAAVRKMPPPSQESACTALETCAACLQHASLAVAGNGQPLTLVCTDVEGSTELWEWDNEAMMLVTMLWPSASTALAHALLCEAGQHCFASYTGIAMLCQDTSHISLLNKWYACRRWRHMTEP